MNENIKRVGVSLVSVVVVLGLAAIGLLFIPTLPYIPALDDHNAGSRLSALSAYVYTIITLGMFLAVILTLTAAKNELSEARKSREATFLLELCRWYASKEMHEALRFVYHNFPREFRRQQFRDAEPPTDGIGLLEYGGIDGKSKSN